MTAGITDAVNDLRDFGVEAVSIRFSLQRQDLEESVLETLDLSEYQGIAINSAGPRIARQINRITESGIPVITFNTDAANSTRRFFVGNDSFQSGRMGAALLGRFLGGQGAVTVLGNFAQAMLYLTIPVGGFFIVYFALMHMLGREDLLPSALDTIYPKRHSVYVPPDLPGLRKPNKEDTGV